MTYQQAKLAANKTNPNIVYMGDAGNGCMFEVYWCSFRQRQVWTTITASGVKIV